MPLAPDMTERAARARADLRIGLPVVITGADGTGAVALAAEDVAADRLAALRDLGPETHIALTARRAATLKVQVYDDDLARVALPRDAGAAWIAALADPADDLRVPMKGPFTPLRGGDAGLARAAIALTKGAQLLPAALLTPVAHPAQVAMAHDLTLIPAHAAHLAGANAPAFISGARLPMAVTQAGRLHIFRPDDGGEEHYAVEIGSPPRDAPVLCRLHSACFTGDVLGSLKCDCGPQLHAALQSMADAGAGVLLYLNQEGRGIGLANKMRAYDLQDQGFDTVEANHRLGFEDDERDFRLGARILSQMGFGAVRLLTNNPRKIARMQDAGITVTERVPLKVGVNPLNRDYLATKAAKSGHML